MLLTLLTLSSLLFAQTFTPPEQAYLQASGPGIEIATATGRYAVVFGYNCDDFGPGQNVELWRFSDVPEQGVIAPFDAAGQPQTLAAQDDGTLDNQLCSLLLEGPISDWPCAVNTIGVCDYALDSTSQ